MIALNWDTVFKNNIIFVFYYQFIISTLKHNKGFFSFSLGRV